MGYQPITSAYRKIIHLLLLLLSVISFPLTAQEVVEKITSLSYGTDGNNYSFQLYSNGGELYTTFSQYYGDNDAGLISRIDTTTGLPFSIMNNQQTGWQNGSYNPSTDQVFTISGKTFAIQRNSASGNNLYRVENNQATLLHTANQLSFSNIAELNGELYFVAAGKQFFPATPSQAVGEMDLFRTDGTPSGTTKLLSFEVPDASYNMKIIPGDQSLMIIESSLSRISHYIYRPETEEFFTPTALGIEDIRSQFPYTVFNPATFWNGKFYSYGGTPFGGTNLIVIEEFDASSSQVVLENSFITTFGQVKPPSRLTFHHLDDQLFFTANSAFTISGTQLYQIVGNNGTAVIPIFRPDTQQNRQPDADEMAPLVLQDTLFFFSRTEPDTSRLFVFSAGMAEVEPYKGYTIEGVLENAGHIIGDGQYLYISSSGKNFLDRLDRTTGIYQRVSLSQSQDFRFSPQSAVELHFGSAYFCNYLQDNPEDSGLYKWLPGDERPFFLKKYAAPRDLSTPEFVATNRLTEQLFFRTDSLYVINLENYSIQSLLPPNIYSNSIRYIRLNDSVSLFQSSLSNNRAPRLLRSTQAGLNEFTIHYPEEFSEESYGMSYQFTYDENKFIGIFQKDRSTSFDIISVSGVISGSSISLTNLLPDESGNLSKFGVSDNKELMYLGYEAGVSLNLVVLNKSLEVIYRFSASTSAKVAGLTDDGIFIYAPAEASDNFELRYYAFDVEPTNYEPFDLSESSVEGAIPTFYTIGNKLLYPGYRESGKLTWNSAEPGSSTIQQLADVALENPAFVFQTEELLFFNAITESDGLELWVTDGSEAGTNMIADINPGQNSSNTSDFYRRDSTLFFTANGPSGYEIYRMHLRDLVPELIVDLNAGPGSSHPYGYSSNDDQFYFFGREAAGTYYQLYTISYVTVPTEASPTSMPAHVFPNPVGHSLLTITAPAGEIIQRIQLFSTNGQIVREGNANSEKTDLDLSGLPSGQYWLRTWYNSGRFSLNPIQRVK